MHFPDTAPEWKHACSVRFFEHTLRLAAEQGFQLSNIDSTVILQRPKLKDFRDPIRNNLARAAGLPMASVSVKFKTAEEVGPVGEGRSCEAQAVVLLSSVPKISAAQ